MGELPDWDQVASAAFLDGKANPYLLPNAFTDEQGRPRISVPFPFLT